MTLPLTQRCDVLVFGSGIAGLMAALEAAGAGCAVVLATEVQLFSGSSFYPGTWGLGLIGPEDDADRADLARTIRDVGCGMADPAMVSVFVDGIHPAIEKVRDMGVKLRRAVQEEQREYIPCFDHKNRDWNGIEFDSARAVFSRKIRELGIQVLEGCQLVELVQDQSRVQGAVVLLDGQLRYLGCRALVLATGGYGSLFRHHLCTEDVSGVGQALALKAGCTLINMEFMQMMPGYLDPAPKTIFNEKTFRFVHLTRPDGAPLLPEDSNTQHLLEVRATHGPFTTRLDSRKVDLALFRACLEDNRGVTVTYSQQLRDDPPEFITTYFDWLREAKGLTMDDPVRIGVFSHAANGGVRIAPDGSTGVPGLFACGEITGGMHGADRIGGLSTANGLVFGGRAGRAAAASCVGAPEPPGQCMFLGWGCADPGAAFRSLQELMFRSAMILRDGTGLKRALGQLDQLQAGLERRTPSDDVAAARACRLSNQLITARCVLTAAYMRRESRGAHYREDYPTADPALARPILLRAGRPVEGRFGPPFSQGPSDTDFK